MVNAATVPALIPPQKREFIDPATEFQVTRWTEESAVAELPADPDRALTRNDQQLLYASDRRGKWQPYALQIPKGESLPLGEAEDLQPGSLAWLRGDKEAIFIDGESLVRVQVQRARSRRVYEAGGGWKPTGALRISPDDKTVALLEMRGQASRAVVVDLNSGKGRTVLESAQGGLTLLDYHPRFGLLLLNARGLVMFPGAAAAPNLPPFPAGRVLDGKFDQSGSRLMYLLQPEGTERTQLMEAAIPAGAHQFLANTSKFAVFAPNADGSVFVGASGSVAQPLLLLLLRVTRREFSLMEHSASQPSVVRPFFSHDSQTIFFQSDRLGKNCVFSVSVKGLVERT